ncbi:MAG: hypothetical protein JNN00_17920 [Chitinophagaceae bacterium]|nr:hypothetical protein [Chitinophagaceae bacterium]
MFRQTWKKYLPAITILMKRSGNGEQMLNMNHTDFERAAGGRKVKFTFSKLSINNGWIDQTAKPSPFAKEFAEILIENEATNVLIRNKQFEFALNKNFQLVIKNNSASMNNEPVADRTEATDNSTAV